MPVIDNLSARAGQGERLDRRDPAAPEPRRDEPTELPARLILGDWVVDVATQRLQRGDASVALEPRPLAVLVTLCRRPGVVLSAEDLLDACWPGEAMSDNPVHKVIAGLRRALGDSAGEPRYIETIRKKGYRLIAPTRVLSASGVRSHQGGWRGMSPFCGLEAFGPQHASVFFGRDAQVLALRARLARQWLDGHPFVLLLGPSGSGKTSVVHAGLLPIVGERVRPAGPGEVGFRSCAVASLDLGAIGQQSAWQALAGAMLDWELGDAPLLSGHSVDTLAAALQGQPDDVIALLRTALDACPREAPRSAPPLLVLDRLEALLRLPDAELLALLAMLDRLLRARLFVVLAICRNDFYGQLAAHPLLMRDKDRGAHMDLSAPDSDAIAQMIRLPARAAGLSYGSDASGLNRLDDRLCADAMHARDALPLLQYTLQALYSERAPGDVLLWETYDALGGLGGAVGARAEAALAPLPELQQAALPTLFARLVVLASEEAAPTSRWIAFADLATDAERALVHALVEARLLVADHAGGRAGLRVAHEAVLRCWPRATAWVARHRALLAAREELAPWIARWVASRRAGTLLLPRGTMLWKARATLAAEPALFDADGRDFVERSVARTKRHRRWLLACAVAAAALALAASIVAARNAQLARTAAARQQQSLRLASFMLGELADQLRPLGKLDLLGRVGEQGLAALSLPITGDETPQDILQRARALVVIGEVNSTRGQERLDVARAALQQAWQLLEPLEHDRRLPRADYYRTLGTSAFWLGQIAFDAGDWTQATLQMTRYRSACERWRAALPQDPQASIELAFAVGSLGSIAIKQSAWAEAERLFQSSLALKEQALARAPGSADAIDAVATARTWLGQLALIQGRPLDAWAQLDLAFAAEARLQAARPEESVRLHNLGVLEVRRSEAAQALGRRPEALQAIDGAVARLQQASTHDPSNRRWRAEGLHAQAGRLLLRAVAGLSIEDDLAALRRKLDAEPPDTHASVLWQESAARASTAEAEFAARAGDWPRAAWQARVADELTDKLLLQQPHGWQEHALRGEIFLLLAQAPASFASLEPAHCARAASRLQPAVAAGEGGQALEAWILARRCAGQGVDADATRRLTAGGYAPVAFVMSNR